MKHLKKSKIYYVVWTIVIIMLTLSTAVSVQAATKIKLNKTNVTIFVGESVKLKVNNKKEKCIWKSVNKDVATVSSTGKVTGKKIGSTYIYAKVGGKQLKCKVNVKSIWNGNTKVVNTYVGESTKVKIELLVNSNVFCSVGNKNVLSCNVDQGQYSSYKKKKNITVLLKGKKAGETYIYICNGYTKEKYRVTVIVNERGNQDNYGYADNYDKLKYYMEIKNSYTDTYGTRVIIGYPDLLEDENEAEIYIRYSPQKNIFTFEIETLREDDLEICSYFEVNPDRLPYIKNTLLYTPNSLSVYGYTTAVLDAKINMDTYGKQSNVRYKLDPDSKDDDEYAYQELCNQTLKRLVIESDKILSELTGMHMNELGFLQW